VQASNRSLHKRSLFLLKGLKRGTARMDQHL